MEGAVAVIAPVRWRLEQARASQLARELESYLAGRRLEKLWRPSSMTLSMKVQGIAERLWFDVSLEHPHVRLTQDWPENPHNPDRETLLFRKHLTQARILSVALVHERRLVFTLRNHGQTYELSLQLAGRYPNVALASKDEGEHIRLIASRPAIDDRSPTLPKDREPIGRCGDDSTSDLTFLQAFDLRLSHLTEHAECVHALNRLGRDVRALHKRAKRSLEAIRKDQDRAMKADLYRSHGEWLKTVLHTVRRGMVEVEAKDWSSGQAIPVKVPLDPLLTPAQNLERCFKLYRKYSGAREQIARRLAAQRAREKAISELLTSVEETSTRLEKGYRPDLKEAMVEWHSQLKDLGGNRPVQGARTGRSSDRSKHVPYREFVSKDGTVIWLGRSAKDNDRLTLHEARGHDIWLHARDSPGSHVILRCTRGAEPNSESLLDAAMLAAWHSKLRGEATVDVMWTHRKNVRKAKGAAPGQVSVSESRTLSVRHEAERLERIYATETR